MSCSQHSSSVPVCTRREVHAQRQDPRRIPPGGAGQRGSSSLALPPQKTPYQIPRCACSPVFSPPLAHVCCLDPIRPLPRTWMAANCKYVCSRPEDLTCKQLDERKLTAVLHRVGRNERESCGVCNLFDERRWACDSPHTNACSDTDVQSERQYIPGNKSLRSQRTAAIQVAYWYEMPPVGRGHQ